MNKGLTIYRKFTSDTTFSLQIHQKRPICPTCDNQFIALSEYLLPFIFTRTANADPITSFTIKDINDNVVETINNDKIGVVNAGLVDYVYCLFSEIGTDAIACGLYYYELTFPTEVFYSELFRVIDKDIEFSSEDIAVNGNFTSDLSGWTVGGGAVWTSGSAQMVNLSSISQTTGGIGLLKVTITISFTVVNGNIRFGLNTYPLAEGTNVFYIPSNTLYTIENLSDDSIFFVDSVVINQAYRVECYNLLVARNNCNKSGIPYNETGYTDVFVLDGELSEPTYPRTDDTVENYRKEVKNTFIKIDKVHVLSLSEVAYEPLLDELQKIPASDVIYIYNDVWKKEFTTSQGTLDVQVESEYPFEDRCNAEVRVLIVENLISATSCCEEIEGLGCCDEFGFSLNTASFPEHFTVSTEDPLCSEGTNYYVDTYNEGDFSSSTLMVYDEETGQYTVTIIPFAEGLTWKIRSSKLGCPDIEYDLNVS